MNQNIQIQEQRAASGAVRWLLRAEAALVLALSLWLYARHGAGWPTWLGCFLLPDLALLAYLAGPRTGALAYNCTHSYAGPLICLLLAQQLDGPWWSVGLIWLAHVGFDRMLGYGLKYGDGFGFTHLGRIGRLPGKPHRVGRGGLW